MEGFDFVLLLQGGKSYFGTFYGSILHDISIYFDFSEIEKLTDGGTKPL